MALGAAPGADRTTLERSHREALAEPGRTVVVAELDGEVVGMAHVAPSGAANAPHRAEVQRVAVAESVRGAGVGRRLMEAVEVAAIEQGLSDACAFYEAIGYTKLGVMADYSLRPDGTVSPAAFYFKELRRSS